MGELDVATVVVDTPHVLSLDTPKWELPDSRFIQVNWECHDEPTMGLTPPSCHPSIPPFASFFAGHYPDTPVGPFTMVQVRLVVRAGIRPRGFCLGAVCDSAEATEVLRSNWGYPVVHGDASVSVRHDRITAEASIDGSTVIEMTLPDTEAIGGADLMTFDNLHLIRLGEPADATICQIDPEFVIHKAERTTRPRINLPDPHALGMAGRLALSDSIVGFSFTADTDMVPPRFRMDPLRPAVQGTVKIERAS